MTVRPLKRLLKTGSDKIWRQGSTVDCRFFTLVWLSLIYKRVVKNWKLSKIKTNKKGSHTLTFSNKNKNQKNSYRFLFWKLTLTFRIRHFLMIGLKFSESQKKNFLDQIFTQKSTPSWPCPENSPTKLHIKNGQYKWH